MDTKLDCIKLKGEVGIDGSAKKNSNKSSRDMTTWIHDTSLHLHFSLWCRCKCHEYSYIIVLIILDYKDLQVL